MGKMQVLRSFKPCTRWFKVTFWFLGWRSLNLSKGLLTNPKRAPADLPSKRWLFLPATKKFPPKKVTCEMIRIKASTKSWHFLRVKTWPWTQRLLQRDQLNVWGIQVWSWKLNHLGPGYLFVFMTMCFCLGEKTMNFQMMISAIGQKQLGPGDAWGYWLYISFVVISSFDESLTETPKKTGERQTSQRSNSDKSSF